MIPGGNLLNAALTLIASQGVRYFANTGQTDNGRGQLISAFAPGVDIAQGSVQAVPLTRYEVLGLDREKTYVSWFVSINALGVGRNRAGDEFEWNGGRYGIVGDTNWHAQDGWVSVIGVWLRRVSP